MSCTNCFNGCTEITSDKCVRYTGADIPALGIQNGDTLLFVEQTLAQFIISALDGTGIKPVIDPAIICNVVSANLPTCGDFTITDLITGLIKSVCDLQDSITSITQSLENLETPYDDGCLTVVETTFSNTHNVLQAVIVQLCQLQSDFDTLVNVTLPATYVPLNGPNGIEDIIAQALADAGLTGPTTKQYTKMVPYTAIPWFAPNISGLFDSTGRGIDSGEYQYIYLCNGLNNTPDLRGMVLAGVTTGMAGNTLPADVNPLSSTLNPDYTIGLRYGTNFVTLEIPQMPSHSHTAESVDAGHTHGLNGNLARYGGTPAAFVAKGGDDLNINTTNISESSQADITTTLTETGQNLAHTNTQPTIGCYYIMYIPA
jgi:microcystin-dependent protein